MTISTLAQNGHNCAGVGEISGEWNLSLLVGFYVHLLLYTLHIVLYRAMTIVLHSVRSSTFGETFEMKTVHIY